MEVVYVPKAAQFIQDLPNPLDARTKKTLDLLEALGHTLRMPYSRSIARNLFELRVLGAVQVRLLYCFHNNQAIILHALIKKRNALSAKDIAHARAVQKEVLADV
ncbi:MAG: type II toxin-antitoxin system RelE/ParE family toxin [bacterium]|nr:type II toxin-antitoxin system RelE/ParE family toxin [bacterium]